MGEMDLSRAPWYAVSGWMTDALKLKGAKLAVYALLYERDVRPTADSGRIDAEYIGDASGLEPTDLFGIFVELATKDRLLEVNMAATGGMASGFKATEGLLAERLAEKA